MIPGSAASISSATTCVSSRPCSGSGPPNAARSSSTVALGPDRPLVERAEELRRVVGREPEQVVHGVHNAPR